VEDHDFIMGAFANLLTELCPHAQLTIAQTVEEARAVLRTEVFRLIFLDDCLPDGRGHELLVLLLNPPHSQALVVGFTGSQVTERLSSPHLDRYNGHVNKTEAKGGLTVWLARAGFPGRRERSSLSTAAQSELRHVAQTELQQGLASLECLMAGDDMKAIAAQGHRLIGLTGFLQQNDLRQILETIQETAHAADLEASREAWSFLKIVLKQQGFDQP
jgi:CheY-like chemotaxis protein